MCRPDRQHKLKVGLSTDIGSLLVARTKLRHGWVHSAALAIVPATGMELQLKSRCWRLLRPHRHVIVLLINRLYLLTASLLNVCRPATGHKYSLTLQPQRRMALGSVQLRPEGGSTRLKATAICSFCDSTPKPKLALDLTWSV